MNGTRSQEGLTEIRRLLAGVTIYSEPFVYKRCTMAYGRPITERTWQRWQRKVRAEADPQELGGMSEATYLLLLTLAQLLRGNSEKSRSKQVSVSRLVMVAEALMASEPPHDIPAFISYEELRKLTELQALRAYSERYHRQHGLKRSQRTYSKSEALNILSTYPDYSFVYTGKHQKPL